jgi:serine/threonine-protein kinase
MPKICPSCGQINRDEARFCGSCSAPLTQSLLCPACGATNLPNARFCHQCTTPLAAGASQPMAGTGTGMLLPNSLLAGRYLIVQRVGRGGMGAVYKATDTRLGQKVVAVKEMSEAALTNQLERQQARQAFEQEAQMLARLDHPNLPRVTDHFSEAGKQYLVMDFVDGQTLEGLLDQTSGFLNVRQVVDWAGQLCDVLDYLHKQQPAIIFRDLKPANIMLGKDGKIKLIDFGIARLFKPGKSADTTSFGTAGYAPPEQYGKGGQTDARSDIYALGATLHHLLTRRDPAQSPFAFPPLRGLNAQVPEGVERVIAKALEHDPARRWQSAQEMGQALRSLQAAPAPAPQPAESRPSPAPRVTASVTGTAARLPVSVNAHRLDFGTVLPARIRWLPLVLTNRNAPAELRISIDQPWIAVAPTLLKSPPRGDKVDPFVKTRKRTCVR